MDEQKKSKTDLHQVVLNLLQEKRELIIKNQDERKVSSDCKKEIERLQDELKASRQTVCSMEASSIPLSSTQGSSQSFQEHDLVSRLELEKAILEDKLSTADENLRENRAKIASLENQKFVLQGETMRLAQALSKANPNMELELTREQLRIYEQDYRKEKTDKDVAEKKASNLHLKVHDYEELVSTLTTQVELYKRAFEREKEEKEELLRERVGAHNTVSSYGLPEDLPKSPVLNTTKSPILPRTQLQLVHPLSDSKTQEELKRKQELQRMGILTRDSKPSVFFHGGDVEIDQYSNF